MNRIEIELITKKDLRPLNIAEQIFNTLCRVSKKLVPDFVNNFEPINIPVESLDTWSKYWSLPAQIKTMGSSFDADYGILWRRKKAVKYWGAVNHNHDLTAQGTTFIISSAWNNTIPWEELFDDLVAIVEPEYASLHAFTENELSSRNHREPYYVGGLWKLVSYKYEGSWRKPDRWDKDSWQNYKFLPDLSWKVYLGPGFQNQYSLENIDSENLQPLHNGGVFIKVTDSIADVISKFDEFQVKRKLLRNKFNEGFFTETLDA